jgi:hypothetical protein
MKTRLPTAFHPRENVVAVGLLSYGPNLNVELRQSAVYIDHIPMRNGTRLARGTVRRLSVKYVFHTQ